MKTFVSALLVSALLLAGCAAKTAVVTPPGPTASPNQGLIDAADALQVACEVAAPLAGSLGTLISQACPPLVTGILNVIESSGTLAALQAGVKAFAAEVAAVPGASSNRLIADILAVANGLIGIYAAATGQILTPASSHEGAYLVAVSAHKLALTPAEKARLAAIKARAAKLAKK